MHSLHVTYKLLTVPDLWFLVEALGIKAPSASLKGELIQRLSGNQRSSPAVLPAQLQQRQAAAEQAEKATRIAIKTANKFLMEEKYKEEVSQAPPHDQAVNHLSDP